MPSRTQRVGRVARAGPVARAPRDARARAARVACAGSCRAHATSGACLPRLAHGPGSPFRHWPGENRWVCRAARGAQFSADAMWCHISAITRCSGPTRLETLGDGGRNRLHGCPGGWGPGSVVAGGGRPRGPESGPDGGRWAPRAARRSPAAVARGGMIRASAGPGSGLPEPLSHQRPQGRHGGRFARPVLVRSCRTTPLPSGRLGAPAVPPGRRLRRRVRAGHPWPRGHGRAAAALASHATPAEVAHDGVDMAPDDAIMAL
ncbi:hypothetical protein SAMN05216223_101255 [Actinacidiphila yanglinensis]|uniref:Uncharacterized protein n=1 Tax=Actinacidiphila yanglinensis TaxID=310779 RepID=A0A1H5SU37_9ACTN|nr:hypothetical protein SAMN05216223_101255 [Actinacidiphila yanglinensis]